MTKTIERRLAAILAADAVGYTRLMGADEIGTIVALREHRNALIDPVLASHRGRIFKTTGDGFLAEFASIVDAVAAAVALQRGMATRNANVAEGARIVFRIGVNLGDIVVDGADVLGDGVNVAARLEGLCEPGGVCLSRAAHDQIRDKLAWPFVDRGDHAVKNVPRPIGIFMLGSAAVASLPDFPLPRAEIRAEPAGMPSQDIRFCKARDGVRLAYSRIGNGPPLVKTGNWMTHLEFDLESPIWRHLYRELAKDHTLYRYDTRGNGLSDWKIASLDFEACLSDLEAVVDAAGIEQFDLFGISYGAAIAVAYAARHPERVAKLVLYGGFAVGWGGEKGDAAVRDENAALLTLIRLGWGRENPAFRQVFTSQFIPEATKEEADWFNELQRVSASPDNTALHFAATGSVDVRNMLAQVKAPTLVLHARGDARVPFEMGRRMAAKIDGSRFVALESRNHLILEHEPAFPRFVEEIRAFLRP